LIIKELTSNLPKNLETKTWLKKSAAMKLLMRVGN